MKNINGNMPRCLHGVYTIATNNGVDNPNCSCCTPILIELKAKTVVARDATGTFKNLRKNSKAQPVAE